MTFRDLFADTFRTLWTHKRRTALSMFGIAWGIVSMILMVAAGEGLREGQRRRSENFGKNIMILHAGRTSLQAGGAKAGRRIRWQDTDHTRVLPECPSCRCVMPELGRGDIPVRSRYNNASPLITGALPEFAEIRSVGIAEGRFYNAEDVAVARRVAFLGTEVADQLFASRAAVGETIHIGAFPYTVIGVMRRKTQNSSYDGWDVRKIFIPFSTIMRDFPEPPPSTAHDIDRLLITPKSMAEHEPCKFQALRALGRIHQFDPADKEAVFVWDTIKNAKAIRQITDGMKYFLGAVGLTTLFLGGIGVMNVMLVAVRERTREIGVRKAVGATANTILRQFFVETSIIVFLSGAVGLAGGYGLCALVNLLPMPEFFVGMLAGWQPGVLAFALLGTVALLAAMYPASEAASVDPIEALRHEAGS
jgi:putative ABC transport system permease protein